MFHRTQLVSHLVLAVALLLLSGATVQASYWADEVLRVRTNAAAYYMDRMSKEPTVSTLPSGVLFKVLARGSGDRAPAATDKCEMHYTIDHRYSAIIDDTRNEPYPVLRAPADLIPGMAEAMQLMREGDRWFLYVPYQLAYGDAGWKERKVGNLVNVRVDLAVYKCDSASGKTSEEIDAYLAPLMKVPMLAKRTKA